ncbi:hypothetical protein AVEN_211754-1 [Araneus ventricosus]|uniref:Uncharacterized protein n=1 Tax=Araneus ventricosus TaxID=182803 RepID=A0A4Y2S1A1_ARAVE|nr:hypothetical protein AVEN_211754-1 [Araneus ventricosus]
MHATKCLIRGDSGAFTTVPFDEFWNTRRENEVHRFTTFRQGRKPMKFGANGLEVMEFQRTQSSKLHPPIPIWNLDAKVAGKQRICLHWDLASRLEMKLEIPRVGEKCEWEEFCYFEPYLKTNFGPSVNDLPNFSTKMIGI